MNMLRMARVADVHPEDNSVDIVMVDDGSRWPGVQVLAVGASTRTGLSDMPDVTAVGDKWTLTEQRGQDMLAIVSFLSPAVPIVLGFLFPQVNQVLFSDRNRKVSRHASDVYSTIDGDGNAEFYHPSGTFLRIGTSAAHEDLTGKDYDALWSIDRNTDKAVNLRVVVANAGVEKASVTFDPNGNITITHAGNLSVTTQGQAQVNVSGTTTVVSGGAVTVQAPSVTLDAPSTTLTGNLTVQGSTSVQAITSRGKNISSTHTHSGVTSGPSNTGVPN